MYCRQCCKKIGTIQCPECAYYDRYYGTSKKEGKKNKDKSRKQKVTSL